MTEAVKPATDSTAKSAAGSDAPKDKEKAAAEGAHDKFAKEVTDATKPGDAKKPEDAAKKPEDAAKKPEDVAKKPEDVANKPEEESLFNRIYNGVGDTVSAISDGAGKTVSALWNIRQPDKTSVTTPDATSKATIESKGFIDFGSASLPGYDVGVKPVKLDGLNLESTKPEEKAKETSTFSFVGDAFNFVSDAASSTWSWGKQKFEALSAWSSETMNKALEGAVNLDKEADLVLKSSDFKSSTITKDPEIEKILGAASAKDATKMTDGYIASKYGDYDSYYNRKTKEIHSVDAGTGNVYDKLSDGTEVVTTKDGTRYIKRGDNQMDIVKGDVVTRIEGNNVYQQFGVFKTAQLVGETWKGQGFNALRRNRENNGEADRTSTDDAVALKSENGTQFAVIPDAKGVKQGYVLGADGTRIRIDFKTHEAIREDASGKELERGTINSMSRHIKGLKVDEANQTITIEGCNKVLRLDKATGEISTVMVNPDTGEKLTSELKADGKDHSVYTDSTGKVLAENTVNHHDPKNLFVEQDGHGNVVSTYNGIDGSFATADGSISMSSEGTYLSGHQVYNSSPGAIQASEAAASSASVTAYGLASQLSAKAANPVTISHSDLSQCYSAYGSISAALQQCLASGNFAGVGQCLAAQGALASAIGVIAPKLVAMADARSAGLSEYETNRVGQNVGQGGDMSSVAAIDEVKLQQNSRTA